MQPYRPSQKRGPGVCGVHRLTDRLVYDMPYRLAILPSPGRGGVLRQKALRRVFPTLMDRKRFLRALAHPISVVPLHCPSSLGKPWAGREAIELFPCEPNDSLLTPPGDWCPITQGSQSQDSSWGVPSAGSKWSTRRERGGS